MEKVKIYKAGSLPRNQASENSFTGEVLISNYFDSKNPNNLVVATVTFSLGSRTPWKINPLGQTLVITTGIGWAQFENEEVFEINAGDIVQFPPEKKHWEGAMPNHSLTYFALHEAKNGIAVQFLNKVTDEEYQRGNLISTLNENKN